MEYQTTVKWNDKEGRYDILIKLEDEVKSASYLTPMIVDTLSKEDLFKLLINSGIDAAREPHAVSI